MNTFVVVFCAVLAVAYANLGIAKILQGPSSHTTVVDHDGKAISSVAVGGSIITEEHHDAHEAPVVAYGAPAVVARTFPYYDVAPAVVAHAAPVFPGPLGTVFYGKSYGLPYYSHY